MRRPSHWILLSTAIAGAIYLSVTVPGGGASRAAGGPVVVSLDREPPSAHAGSTVVGKVVDHLGWPIAGATVRAGADERAVSNADGEFALEIDTASGDWVTVSAPSCESFTCWMGPTEVATCVLEPDLPWVETSAAAMTGDGEGLLGEGFLVDAKGEAVTHGVVAVAETGVQAVTDDTGRYRIALPSMSASLVAWDGEGHVARSELVSSNRDNGLVPLPQLVLKDGATVRGLVKDEDGDPVADVALVLNGEGMRRQVRTNEGGTFAFSGLVSGDYVLETLPHRGSVGLRRQVSFTDHDAEAAADFELVMVAAKPLVVHVFEDDEPVPGVWVVAEENDMRSVAALTDADGRVALTGLGSGPFDFEVRERDTYAKFEILAFDGETSRLIVRAQ